MAKDLSPDEKLGPVPKTDQDDFEMAWAKHIADHDLSDIKPEKHDLYQDGSFIKCKTPGHEHGFNIGPLKQLVMRDGKLAIERVEVVHNAPAP